MAVGKGDCVERVDAAASGVEGGGLGVWWLFLLWRGMVVSSIAFSAMQEHDPYKNQCGLVPRFG